MNNEKDNNVSQEQENVNDKPLKKEDQKLEPNESDNSVNWGANPPPQLPTKPSSTN